MSRTNRCFILASLVYFLLGSLTGLLLAAEPVRSWLYGLGGNPRGMHAHLNLVGFMGMMIFGVGYHILPRFHGRPLYSETLASLHFWLSNLGLVGMSAAFAAAPLAFLLPFFAAILLLSILIFIFNLWRTVALPVNGPGH
mgnify:CR=1 FL=1